MSRELRTGFTTGTAAAAAARAALELLLDHRADRVMVRLPSGGTLEVAVESAEVIGMDRALATVIKDAGDDPDVTHRAAIQAEVRLLSSGPEEMVRILGGRGVGVVTKPGLELEVGQAAINPVPRQMIRRELRRAWIGHGLATQPLRVEVTIIAPRGEELAVRTLNPRLGIQGGISILGTTGLVKPFSHEAYIATINSGLSVARAEGLDEVVFTTGRRSEKQAMALRPDLPDTAFIQIADFFAHSLESAGQGMATVGAVSFFGKAVKQAQAMPCTHARQGVPDLARLSRWLLPGGDGSGLAAEVAQANTARHALEVLRKAGRLHLASAVLPPLVEAMRRFAGPRPNLWATLLDYDGAVLGQVREQGEVAS